MPTPGPQFDQLFHGTSQVIKDAVVPAKTHGGLSHWEDTGSHLGQASQDHAFATTRKGRRSNIAKRTREDIRGGAI